MSVDADTPRAGRREWIGLAVLTLACLLYVMDLTVLHLAVPSLSAELKPSSAQLLWIIDIYGFLIAGSLITMGTLGDRIGRRRLLLTGAAAFGGASLLAAFSVSADMLIAARALMGVAGATLAPSTLSLIFNMFLDPKQRSVAIGVWLSAFSAGSAIGPVLGGVLLEFFWWGSVFLLALPVMALLLLLGPRVLPEFKDPEAGRLDLLSAGMSLLALLAVIYGLKETAQDGFGALPGASILVGLALGTLFVRRQLTLSDPLIDVRLFQLPSFNGALATNVLAIFVAVGYFLYIPQYMQLVLELSPLQAGLWSVPSAVGFIVGSNLAPRFVHRIPPATVIVACMAVAAVGLALLTRVGESDGLAVVVAASLVISLALSPVFALTTELIVGSAPPARAGAASGMSETGAELGGALGIAILGSVGTAVYRSAVAGALPSDISPEAAEVARGTLGGAVEVARQLPEPLGPVLLDAARGAFVQAFELTAAISAAIALGTAALAVVLLRGVRAGGESEEESMEHPSVAVHQATDGVTTNGHHADSRQPTETTDMRVKEAKEMIKGLSSATIWSEDLKNLLPFYRDVLGLKVAMEAPGFVVLGDDVDRPSLGLGSHSEVKGRASDPYRHMVGLDSDDLDADYQRLRSAGVEFIEEPTDYDGLRIATLKDPEGNLVQLFQPTT